MPVCPVCSGDSFSTISSGRDLSEECRIRERFIHDRVTRPLDGNESKDLTDFFHSEKAEIRKCNTCTLLIRHESEPPPAEQYSEDEYDPGVVDRQYPAYVDAFRRKETPYRRLLPESARVLEVGSHYGAFLHVAREWGWKAEGVDVGKDTREYAQSKGFTVHRAELTECSFPDATFDGIFIWNCFEQIDNPVPTLIASRQALKPGGLLTLRTPNGLFYSICRSLLRDGQLETQAFEFLIDAMGYNNILGFPYLYGHNRSTLERLAVPFGFRPEGFLNSELLTLPVPDKSGGVAREEAAINREMGMLANSIIKGKGGVLTGPWIEVWLRAV